MLDQLTSFPLSTVLYSTLLLDKLFSRMIQYCIDSTLLPRHCAILPWHCTLLDCTVMCQLDAIKLCEELSGPPMQVLEGGQVPNEEACRHSTVH